MSFSVSGANNINKRLQLSALGGVALRNFFSQYGQVVVTNSKKEAPRYKGNLRGSLTFKRIDGVGDVKLKKYGATFINLINKKNG